MRIISSNNEELDLQPGVTLCGVMIMDRNVDGVDLTGSSLRDCYFNRSSMRNAILRNCDLTGAVFFRTDLRGSDLTGAVLDGCYWNEAIHDSTTVFPSGFRPPTGDQYLPIPDYSPQATGLCSPGLAPSIQVENEEPEWPTFIPPSILLGALDDPSREILFLRLAVLLMRVLIPDDNDRSMLPFVMFDELPIDEANDDVMFTHLCLMLKSTGIELLSALDEDSVRVRFRPVRHMRTIAESQQMHAFHVLYERLAGVGFDQVEDTEDFDEIEPAGTIDWCFLEDLGGGCDFSTEWMVSYRRNSPPPTDPSHRIVDAMVRYMFTASASCLLFDDDDSVEHRNRSTRRVEEHFGWMAWHATAVLGLRDVVAIDHDSFEATLRPRVDTRRFLIDIGEINEDDSDESWLGQFVTQPRFGLLGRCFP